MHSRLAGAFDGWRYRVQKNRNLRQIADKAVRRMRDIKKAAAFHRWAEAVQEIVELRAKVNRVLMKVRRAVAVNSV